MQSNILYIPIDLIYPNAYQPRKYFSEDSLEELSQSIKSYGIIQPISVRKAGSEHYELVAGERRLKAAKKAGLKEIPAIVIDITDKDSAAMALLENIQRENLNYIEEAEAYYNLIHDHGYTQEQLAQMLGKSQSTIANKLRLLKLSPETRSILLKNNLTERHARALLKVPDENLRLKILSTVVEKSLNVKMTEELINREIDKVSHKGLTRSGKKRIKGIFSSRVYINTIKQVFDKFGLNAKFKSRELDDYVEVTVLIPKK